MNIYENNNGSLFKYLILICIQKMLSFTDAKIIQKIINFNQFSFFMHRLVNHQDAMIVCLTCSIIEDLIKKTPKIIGNFYREGVIKKLKDLTTKKGLNNLSKFSLTEKKEAPSILNYLASHHFPEDSKFYEMFMKDIDIKSDHPGS